MKMLGHKDSGFTIIELIVSVAILSIITIITFKIFSDTQREWSMADRKIRMTQMVRTAMEFMNRELSGAVATTYERGAEDVKAQFYAMKIPQLPLHGGLTNVTNTMLDYPASPQCVFFVAPAVTPYSNNAEMCVVGYFLKGNGAARTPPYELVRFVRNPLNSFNSYYDINGDYPPFNESDDTSTVLAKNVYKMEVISYRREGADMVTEGSWGEDDENSVISSTKLPLAVELKLYAVDERTGLRINAANAALTNSPNSQQFSMFVNFVNAPDPDE